MKNLPCIIAISFFPLLAFTQSGNDSLFDIQSPLNIALSLSIKHVAASKDDTSYLAHTLYYNNSSGIKDSIYIGLKARGNYRLKECYFPPLWIKMEKKVCQENFI